MFYLKSNVKHQDFPLPASSLWCSRCVISSHESSIPFHYVVISIISTDPHYASSTVCAGRRVENMKCRNLLFLEKSCWRKNKQIHTKHFLTLVICQFVGYFGYFTVWVKFGPFWHLQAIKKKHILHQAWNFMTYPTMA